MILNENFQITDGDKSTFRYTPNKQKLRNGTRLYRFVTPNRNTILGQYWLDYQSYSNMKAFAEKQKCSLIQVARTWSAVKYAWNPEMNGLCEIMLKQDCYAWVGLAKFQQYDDPNHPDSKNVLFMGNANQVFIPNLKPQHAQMTSYLSL